MATTFIDFNVIDFTGNNALSSYALSSTPLLFVPEFQLFEDQTNRVVWDFGDDTFSRSTSAFKYYTVPGKYLIKMTVYDCNNNSLQSYFEKEVVIYDFIPLTFNIITTPDPLTFICGKPSSEMVINSYYPVYQEPLNLFYTVYNSNSMNYWELVNYKNNHLYKTYNMYDLFYNFGLSSYQYREIDIIIPTTTKLFGKIEGNNIILCNGEENGCFHVGCSGTKTIYYKDDELSNSVKIYLAFDKTKYTIPSINESMNYLNNLGISLSGEVVLNIPSYLSVTSNGLDGEGYPITSFNINSIKFYNTQIPFVVKVKDGENFTIKNVDELELSALNISITTSNQYNISSLNYTLSAYNHGGSFRGYVEFINLTATDVTENVIISVDTTIVSGTSSYYLSGQSSSFDIYPSNYYDVYKINESFNPSETLRDISFQEILLDNDVLFNDFFGSLLGNKTSTHEGIGLKIYEKISNFTDNNIDLDYCELEALESLCQYIGYNDINEEKYVYPEKIKRLVDLLSVNKNKLFGVTNKFNNNFDTKYRTTKETYGINLGDKIDPLTYIVTPGKDLVALEKFSNTYTRLNTQQPPSNLNIWEHMCAQVDSRLVGKDPLSSSYLFEPTSLSGYRPENPDSWLYGIDKTGWSASEYFGDQAIVLTPRHVSFAAHYFGGTPPPPGVPFNFYDLSGNLTIGTVLSSTRIGSTDIRVVLLTNDLPDTIKPVRIASNEFLDYIDWASASDPRSRTPMVWRNKFRIARTLDHDNTTGNQSLTSNWYSSDPTDPTRLDFYSQAIQFDSGSPISFLFKNDAILVGHFLYGYGNEAGPRYGSYLTEIKNAIDALNLNASIAGDYNLDVVYPSEVDSSYPYYLRDYSDDWGWPLVLPVDFEFPDMEKYYIFFEANNQYDNTVMDGIIDFENTKTTVPITINNSDLIIEDGIYDNMFLSTLYKSLSLIV